MTAPLGEFAIIPSTFAAYADPGFDADITDPESNARAARNYMQARYGNPRPFLPGRWQETDYPRSCPSCGAVVPVGVPMQLVDSDWCCSECAV